MRSSPTAPRPNPGDESVGRRRGPGRRAVVVVAATAVAVLGVGARPGTAQTAPAGSAGDPVTAADADVARLRQQADSLAGAYFASLGQLAEVEQRIDTIEARLPTLVAEVTELRARTQERAVAAYMRSGHDLVPLAGARDPLDAMRRARWLGHLNARDDAVVDALSATSAKLDAQRSELQRARAAATAALDDVRAQGEAIDALLLDAQTRRQTLATAAAAAAASAPDAAGSGGAARPAPSSPAGPVTTVPPTPATPTAPPATSPPPPPSYAPSPGTHPRHDEPFLVCTRTREAGGRYDAYNPAGPYMGAYQFLQATWNSTANHAGRPDLVGVAPHTASPYDQDHVAWALYQWQGSRPWGGMCDDA